MRRALLLLVLLVASPLVATEPPDSDNDLKVATFCEQKYALCIKAPCRPIVTRNQDGTYSIDEANCSCDVIDGWSMGPGSCDARKPVHSGGHTYLISTYSNLYNRTNQTLTCDLPNQTWALCYGAPCVVDEKDPKKAICTCPMKTGTGLTLGGGCRKAACDSIWSAASPAQDKFANDYFYEYATKNKLQPPPLKPADDCP